MKKATRRAPAKRHADKPSTSTALARLTRRLDLIVKDPSKLLPAPVTALETIGAAGELGENATTGALGLVELKLTDEEEKVLALPVDAEEVLVKPTGQIYLSHPTYTRWFNKAFGRTGWAIVATARPTTNGKSVVCPYLLYVHGKPVAFAHGEQEYYEGNKEQTLGDALEATVASALRRCAKRLGVGLELWDKRYSRQFMAERVVEVFVKDRDGKAKKRYRLKTDPPLAWEEGKTRDSDRGTAPKAGSDVNRNEPITEGQRKRLFAIAKTAGRTKDELKAWLAVAYNVDSTTKIKRGDYDTICNAVEKPGPLPEPQAPHEREVGEEG